MKRLFAAALLLAAPSLPARQVPVEEVEVEETYSPPPATTEDPSTDTGDLLRFTNADQLNGHFDGVKAGPLV